MQPGEKWVPIPNPDISKRKPNEWAKIYLIKLIDQPNHELWSEYEWAYHFITDLGYYPDTEDFDSMSEKEMRAIELRRDLFLGADIGENEILKSKYIETAWVKSKLKSF